MIPLLNSFLTLVAYRNRPTVVTIAASMSRPFKATVTMGNALFHRAAAWRVIDGASYALEPRGGGPSPKLTSYSAKK